MSNFDRPPDTLDEHAAAPPEYYPAGVPEGPAQQPDGEDPLYDSAAQAQPGEDTESEPRSSVGTKMAEFRGRSSSRKRLCPTPCAGISCACTARTLTICRG